MWQTGTDTTTKVMLAGILAVLVLLLVFFTTSRANDQQRGRYDRCIETAGSGTFGRTYCHELYG